MQCIVWSPGISLETNERQIIEQAYDYFKQNKAATAQSLGISVRTLEYRLEKYKDASSNALTEAANRKRAAEEHSLRARGKLPPRVIEGFVDSVSSDPREIRPSDLPAASAKITHVTDALGQEVKEDDDMPAKKGRKAKAPEDHASETHSDVIDMPSPPKAAAQA